MSFIGFHSFTGNDYNSEFFMKGKTTYWKVLQTKKFIDTFCDFSVSERPTEKASEEFEEFVPFLYGVKGRMVNAARYTLFESKFVRQNKIRYISLLPPCKQTPEFHIIRSNLAPFQPGKCGGHKNPLPRYLGE